jgi:hypothetical protein
VAGNKRPSFLKRQKEQARMARAVDKREKRRQRKEARLNGEDIAGPEIEEMGPPLETDPNPPE